MADIPRTVSLQQPLPPTAIRDVVAQLREADQIGRRAINLVPSETRLSPLACLPLATDFYNRYFFNQSLAFRGGEAVSWLETELAEGSLGRLAGARQVNTRPISGMNAMTLVIATLAGPRGGSVITIDEASGGHYATRHIVEHLGYRPLTVGFRHGVVNRTELAAALRQDTTALVYLDLQHSLHLLDVTEVIDIVRAHDPSILVHVDASHTLGLVLGGAVPNPLVAGADSMGGSTHKTFPGPHKGVLFTNRVDLASRLRVTHMQLISSHHFAEALSLGLAAAEFERFGASYAAQVLANAEDLAATLDRAGFDVIRADDAFTHTHQVWLRVGDLATTEQFAGHLAEAGIRVNTQKRMPGQSGPVVRLGVNEITFEGAGSAALDVLGEAFTKTAQRTGRPAPGADEVRAAFGRPYFYTDPALFDGGIADHLGDVLAQHG